MRLEFLREQISSDVDFFKEVYQKFQIDIRNFFDDEKFSKVYAKRDRDLEKQLQDAINYKTKFQYYGLFSAIPFFIFGVHKFQLKWFGVGSLFYFGSIYYSSNKFYEALNEKEGLESYWKKSRKFQGDLNKLERLQQERAKRIDFSNIKL